MKALAWSPDGTRIAFVHDGVIEIAQANQPTVPPAPLNNQVPNWNFDPAWSPDGAHVAFVHVGVQTPDWQASYTILVATVGQPSVPPVRLNNLVSNANFTPTWSPDGGYVAFVQPYDAVHDQLGIDIVQVGQPLAPATVLNNEVSALNFDPAWAPVSP